MYTYLTQLFTGGLNKDIDPAAIDLTMGQDMTVQVVADSLNILFERGLALTRPGLASIYSPTVTIPNSHTIVKIAGIYGAPGNTATPQTQRGAFAVTFDGAANHLFSFNCLSGTGNVLDTVEITGPGGYLTNSSVGFSYGQANGVYLLGSFNSGMLRWDPTAGTYTILNAASNFAYVTGHYTRAVAAYGGPSTPLYHQTVGWSAQGDETNWTSLDAGTSTLGDIPDSITGIGVIKGVVVLPRTYGFHLGWATGTFPIIYNWRMYSQQSVGCYYPDTFQIYKDVAYFVSDSGIHTFDTVDLEDIGEGIYEELMTHIRTDFSGQVRPVGFISSSYNTDWRPAYHIILTRQANIAPKAENPHYIYDIREKKWSRHSYGSNFSWVFRLGVLNSTLVSNTPTTVVASQASGGVPSFQEWVPNFASDQSAVLTTGQIQVLGDATHDAQLDRVLVVYNAPSSPTFQITILVKYILNGQPLISTTFFLNTYNNIGGWDKRWVDIRLVGDFFQVQITIPSGAPTPVKFKKLVMEFSQVGKVRT